MTKKELIFLGPPACGKGTQTNKLAEYLKFPHVDTGSLLRHEIQEGTDAGVEAKKFIDKGQLVPADLVAKIIKNRLSKDDCKNGYILDGYPRSLEQAEKLEIINQEINSDNNDVDFRAIYFDIDTNILVERIVNRRSCPVCGEFTTLNSNLQKQKDTVTKTVQNLFSAKTTQEKLRRPALTLTTTKQHP